MKNRIIALFLIIVSLFSLAGCKKNFNYEKEDLSKYIKLSESAYKNYTLNIDIAKPKDIEVDNQILQLLASSKGAARYNGNEVISAFTVTPGATVKIWYRGYILDNDGKELEVSGMCNFAGSSASALTIGSGSFIPGFELGLVGKNTGDYSKFVKITDSSTVITESHVVYVSYTKTLADSTQTTKGSTVRIELSSDVDAKYGVGFKEQVLSAKIGESKSFSAVIDGETYEYTDFVINFATDCENNPIVVKSYFHYDYTTTNLRNETAYFEVYVESGVLYEVPEFNDDFVKTTVEKSTSAITLSALEKYDGASLTDKYRAYLQEQIDKAYEEEYESAVTSAIWNRILESAEVIEYPTKEVDRVYTNYVNNIVDEYSRSGGQIQNSYTGEYESYSSFDTYALAYLGISSTTTDWQTYLYSACQGLVKESLVLYYIINTENVKPEKAEFEKLVEATKKDHLDKYVSRYLEYEGKTREDLSDSEYESFVKAREKELLKYYEESYFEETTLYNLAMDNMMSWAKISTLDERRAYPVDK